jgi:hypothetical protein
MNRGRATGTRPRWSTCGCSTSISMVNS